MLPVLTALLPVIGKTIDKIFPDAEAEQKRKLEELSQVLAADLAQLDVLKTEAAHPSVFVAGWRPAVGWVCALGLFYTTIGVNILTWGSGVFGWPSPPEIDGGILSTVLVGMLGMSGMRTWEGLKGIKRSEWPSKPR